MRTSAITALACLHEALAPGNATQRIIRDAQLSVRRGGCTLVPRPAGSDPADTS